MHKLSHESSTYLRVIASMALPLALVSCQLHGLDESSAAAEPEGEQASALVAHNGLRPNALHPNALHPNALHPNALHPNALHPNALHPNALAADALSAILDAGEGGELSRAFLKYTVGCALRPSDPPFTFSWTDSFGGVHTEIYPGELGLAPAWASGPLDELGQEWITACLGARTNWFHVKVPVSLRGPLPELSWDTGEATTYGRREGAFYGNLFLQGSDAKVYGCYDPVYRDYYAQKGLTARKCTSSCPPINPDVWANNCTGENADGTYSATSGKIHNTSIPIGGSHRGMITTYLLPDITSAGSLTSIQSVPGTSVDLSQHQPTDWAHWGQSGLVRKANGGSQISNYTPIGTGQTGTASNYAVSTRWSDGGLVPTSAGVTDGVWFSGINNGFSLTAPAAPTTRILRLYIGGEKERGKLVASLSDGSDAAVVDKTVSSTGGQYYTVYELTYRSASAGQSLNLSYTLEEDYGSGRIVLLSATLTSAELQVTRSATNMTINLTQEGPLDWAAPSADRETTHSSGAEIIRSPIISSLPIERETSNLFPNFNVSWTNGDSPVSASSYKYYVKRVQTDPVNYIGATLKASTTPRTLKFWMGYHRGCAALEIVTSDRSSPDYVEGSQVYCTTSTNYVLYTIKYRAAHDDQQLHVRARLTRADSTNTKTPSDVRFAAMAVQ